MDENGNPTFQNLWVIAKAAPREKHIAVHSAISRNKKNCKITINKTETES